MVEELFDEKILTDDPSTSDWLRNAIETSRRRDILDALRDAEVLVQVLRARWEGVQQRLAEKY